MWWLLAPHSSLRYLQWTGCLSEMVGGQIFQSVLAVMLVTCWMGIMATSNMSPCRYMARQEHKSRIETSRNRRVVNVTRKQFIAMMLICSCAASAAMEQDAVLRRIITLTEAATRAAMSAESTWNQVQSMISTSSSSAEGLQAASRILKAPDTFSGDDPMTLASWRFQFTSWLTFGDSRYTTLLEKVESLTSAPSITTYDPEKELAHKLYAVLTSYLRGRCSHIIKSFAKSRDGFAIWYQLMREFEPTSRQRSLALAQALASYPVFAKDKCCLESILVYEQTVQQFEESSSTTYPDELKVATLMRCCNSKLREFLQLNIKDSSTYVEVREHIMNYERVSKSWSQEQVLKAIQQDPSRPDSGGPTPMEIDRIEKGKGKNKSKGKSKGKEGKGSGWSSGAWGFGRGRGRGRDGKGKGKKRTGKGKGKNKGSPRWQRKRKEKNRQRKGQEQRKVKEQRKRQLQRKSWPRPMCHLSWLWPLESRMPSQNGCEPGSRDLCGTSTSSTSSQCSYNSFSVESETPFDYNRFNSQEDGPQSPSSSPSSSTLHSSSVRMIKELDEFKYSQWVHVVSPTHGDGNYGDETAEWIILDSGSDVSLLPTRFVADEGSASQHALRDCQGGALTVTGTRYTDLQVQDLSGEDVILRHQFVVGDVTTSLLSFWDSYINLVGDYTKLKTLNNYVWWISAGVWKFQCAIAVSLLHLRLT